MTNVMHGIKINFLNRRLMGATRGMGNIKRCKLVNVVLIKLKKIANTFSIRIWDLRKSCFDFFGIRETRG